MVPRYFSGTAVQYAIGEAVYGQSTACSTLTPVTEEAAVLEQYRPPKMIAREDALFLYLDKAHYTQLGHRAAWCVEYELMGPVQLHDAGWVLELRELLTVPITRRTAQMEAQIRKVALGYWSGCTHRTHPIREYLTLLARVMDTGPFDRFQPKASSLQYPHVSWVGSE